MRAVKHTRVKHKARISFAIWAVLFLLLGADFILTPHAPLHYLPQIGIYMLVTLVGVGGCMGLTRIMGRILRRREDYYDH